jgi:hypothetical protein
MTNRNAGLTDAERILLKMPFPFLSLCVIPPDNLLTQELERVTVLLCFYFVFISPHQRCENIVQKSCKAFAGMGFPSIWIRSKIKSSLKIYHWIVKRRRT